MAYHTKALLPNSCGPMKNGPFRGPKGWSYPQPKYWTHRWRVDKNIFHEISHIRVQLVKSRHVIYHTTALLPKSCGPMADGSFRDPKGPSYPKPKYYTHQWRFDLQGCKADIVINPPSIDGSNVWGVDRNDPWGLEVVHLPLGRSYLVGVSLYEMSCALTFLTWPYGWDLMADIDINFSSMRPIFGV